MATTRVQDGLSWSQIEATLPGDWSKLADDHRLIRNRSPHLGGKVKDVGDILRLVLYMVATNSALAVATATFAGGELLTISAVSLHQWMRKLGPYLAALVARMVGEEHAAFVPERWAGYEVIAVDASVVNNPGAKGTTARVHKAIRLADLRVVEVHVTDEKGGETFRNFTPREGQLWVGDRVYPNPPGIKWVVDHQAAVQVVMLMLDGNRQQPIRLNFEALAGDVLRTHPNALGADDVLMDAGKGEATFLVLYLAHHFDQLWIDKGTQLARGTISDGDIHQEQAQRHANLRGSQAHSGCGVHGLGHVFDESCQFVIEASHDERRLPQTLVGVMQNDANGHDDSSPENCLTSARHGGKGSEHCNRVEVNGRSRRRHALIDALDHGPRHGAQGAAFGSTQQEALAIAAAQALDRSGRGSQQRDGSGAHKRMRLHDARQFLSTSPGLGFITSIHAHG